MVIMEYMDNKNEEVTSADILEFLQEHMVVKEDLKEFATKEDLKEFATKEDLKDLATKEDIRKLDEKFEARFEKVDKRLESIDSRLVEFQTELEDIKIQLAAVEKKLHEDTNALNSLLFSEVSNLKKRVAFLEQKFGLKTADFNGASV